MQNLDLTQGQGQGQGQIEDGLSFDRVKRFPQGFGNERRREEEAFREGEREGRREQEAFREGRREARFYGEGGRGREQGGRERYTKSRF